MKNKTLATWLALAGGPLGLHRFYLRGWGDWLGWLLPLPSMLGLYGILRAQQFGLDDRWSWLLIPLLGFSAAGCALTAIVYGLMLPARWNNTFNPGQDTDADAGATGWLTVAGVVMSLLLGTIVLTSALAFSFQRYFEYRVEGAPKAMQGAPVTVAASAKRPQA
ncbi:MAG: TM2 domain-containing protein [Betaproteobacteria bacterium]|nr:TM2 domain-containing protein [Betaproteobacteria bacterium]